MFCPNCGNNCGDAKFCTECGTKLHQDTMSHRVPVPSQPKATNSPKRRIDIPTTMGFSGRRGVVSLFDSAVSVTTGGINNPTKTRIPFDQLVTVKYLRPSPDGWHLGALLFRGEANKEVPIPDTRHMEFDSTAVAISLDEDLLFYHIFHTLKALAPPSASFEVILPKIKIRKLEEAAQNIDMDYFWNQYAPFRQQAVTAICDKYRINRKIARVLVDREFDSRQKLQYEKNPLEAIRDLNLIVNQSKNKSRLQSELREVQKQEEIEKSLRLIQQTKVNNK